MTKKALVTGADGFIGSHLVELLLSENYEVRALAYYNSFNNWGWLEGIEHERLEVISGDIRDPFFCRKITEDVHTVFHLAALIGIPYSYIAPSSYIEVNVNGTLNLCQASLDNNVQRFIQTSTSEVYGTAKYVPIDEDHPLQPQSPYSASKIGSDAMAMSFYNSFNLPVTIARPFNTYGPRQSNRAIIPTIITQIASGCESIKVGDLSPTRDFTYVVDTCQGFLQLAESDDSIGEIVNIGSNFEISMESTLNMIKEIMNSKVRFIQDSKRLRPKNSEVHRLWCNNDKIKKLTGFVPSFKIEDGLKHTIEWFSNTKNLEKYKSGIYNV